MESGIYSIKNEINGKIYVGSTVNIKKRWDTHRYRLRHGKHLNRHLQAAWDAYGENSFEFSILEICDSPMLAVREEAWILYFGATNPDKGYNMRLQADSNRGMKLSEEHKEKISQALKGRRLSPEQMKNHKIPSRKGAKHPLSEETKRKIGLANKGKQSALGHRHTEEAKMKMSIERRKIAQRQGLKVKTTPS